MVTPIFHTCCSLHNILLQYEGTLLVNGNNAEVDTGVTYEGGDYEGIEYDDIDDDENM